jgi:hypothetical protein
MGGEDNITIQIDIQNIEPKILSQPNNTIAEDFIFFEFLKSDDDPYGTTWALLSDIPWLLLNGTTGLLEGTPNNSMVGQWPVNISVSDTHGGTSWLNFTINVTNVNDPPEWLEVPGDQIIRINDTFIFDVNATDPDIGDIITYGISNSTAPNITINGTTGIIDWPAFPIGNYSVTINTSDGNVTIYHSFNITVYDPTPPNNPPILEPMGNLRAIVGKSFSLQLVGTDPDPWDAVNLTYILDTGPAGLSLDPHTGRVSWTPTEADIGDHTVMMTLTDGKASVNTTFVITVEEPLKGTEMTITNSLLPTTLVLVALIVYGVVITRKLMGERDRDRPGKRRR